MIGMKDTTASGTHTLTGGSLDVLGKERSEYDVAATWDERGRRLGATWLKHTANVGVDGELPSMPFGMTTSAAESLTRVDHARPLVAERDLEMADTFARMRVDALVHGELGSGTDLLLPLCCLPLDGGHRAVRAPRRGAVWSGSSVGFAILMSGSCLPILTRSTGGHTRLCALLCAWRSVL